MMNESKVNVGLKKVPLHLQSSQNRLVIKGAKIVNDDRMFEGDVFIEDGIIKQIGTNLIIPGGVRIVDAAGKYLIPGGIDTHTHMEMPFMGTVSADDFYSGTRAAIAGGTTMIIDFVYCVKGSSLIANYNEYREKADSKVCCDYGLHVIVPSFNDSIAAEMGTLVKEHGVNSFKGFMAYKGVLMLEDDELYGLFKKCKEIGALAQVHAENGHLIEQRSAEVVKRGITGPEGHLYSRPEVVETEATNRAVVLAGLTGCPLLVVHVMSASAANVIADARRHGQIVFGEAIAAGLGSDGSHYFHSCWRHAAGHVLSPPLREAVHTRRHLMTLLANGDLACTGSDHCVFNASQKALGKDDFRKIPNGVNGVEDRMSVIWENGVMTGILDPCKFVAITSTNAAKMFNIYPRKGRIEVGSDADVVIWNGERTRTISAATHHQNVDFNIFEGMVCHGVPEMVVAGGRVSLEDGNLRVAQGSGRFVPTPPFADHVFSKITTRDKVTHDKVHRVEREPFAGEVMDLSREMCHLELTLADSAETNGDAVADEFKCGKRPATSSGGRNMQESSFAFSGAQIDDSQRQRSGVRTHQPPGGNTTSLW